MSFAFRDGKRLQVIRPQNPEKAIARAMQIESDVSKRRISKPESAAQFNAMLSEQEYVFAGYLSTDGQIVDSDGNVIEKLQPGDSFVTGLEEGH